MGYLIDLARHSVETLKYWVVVGLIGDSLAWELTQGVFPS